MSVEILKSYFQKMDLRNSVPCGGDVKIPAVVGFIFPEQLKEQLEKGEKSLIVDVREECEAQKMPFKAEGVEVKIIPIRELLDRLNEIPKDKPVILVCNFAIRASMAKLALDLLGYNNVKVLKGGVEQWNQIIGG
jgi:rhodanese-related sulfurtransferase